MRYEALETDETAGNLLYEEQNFLEGGEYKFSVVGDVR